MTQTNFKQTISQLLIQKGISIAKLSRMVDLNQGTLYNFLNGDSNLGSTNLEKILDTLNKLPNKKGD